MIHLERVRLPHGLRAVAYRDRRGDLVVYVSDALDAKGQQAAVMEAIRASRRAGWRRTGLLPVGAALFLGVRALLGRAVRVIGARPAAWAATATATAVGASAAGVFILAAPHPHGPPAAARPPGPGTVQPTQPTQPTGQRSGGRHRRPVAVTRISPGPGQPASSGQPGPAPTSSGRPAPTPAQPAPTPAQPAPSPSPTAPLPSPSPTQGTPPVCVVVLGIQACLPPVSVSLKT